MVITAHARPAAIRDELGRNVMRTVPSRVRGLSVKPTECVSSRASMATTDSIVIKPAEAVRPARAHATMARAVSPV